MKIIQQSLFLEENCVIIHNPLSIMLLNIKCPHAPTEQCMIMIRTALQFRSQIGSEHSEYLSSGWKSESSRRYGDDYVYNVYTEMDF